jgi:nitroreductase
MGNLLNVAAELKIDVSPMEGFVPEKVNELVRKEESIPLLFSTIRL